jgi:hypothetical protein
MRQRRPFEAGTQPQCVAQRAFPGPGTQPFSVAQRAFPGPGTQPFSVAQRALHSRLTIRTPAPTGLQLRPAGKPKANPQPRKWTQWFSFLGEASFLFVAQLAKPAGFRRIAPPRMNSVPRWPAGSIIMLDLPSYYYPSNSNNHYYCEANPFKPGNKSLS